ncbi:MAG TPA: tyrosine-protein phosphatase [Acidimicrobiales bacterium]
MLQRILPFTGVLNFRDLGGYQTADGRVTRWRHLYRSDVLHDLTANDLELFRSLGVASIVDLRNPAEVERTGRGLLASEPIHFVNASVLSMEAVEEREDTTVLGEDYLWQRYLTYLEIGPNAFVRALEEMAVSDNYPLVFNCFFGKDRTGVLAALVLSCLGVDSQSIVQDYALTETRVELILQKLRADPIHRDTIDQSDPTLFTANARTMSRFLEELNRRHGGARSWAIGAGVDAQLLDLLSDELLE